MHPAGEPEERRGSPLCVAKCITLPPRQFDLEFRDSQPASVHGGQLAGAARLERFGLKARVARAPALAPRTHRGKGFTPIVYVRQRLHRFTRGGVSRADAERLNEAPPLKGVAGDREVP